MRPLGNEALILIAVFGGVQVQGIRFCLAMGTSYWTAQHPARDPGAGTDAVLSNVALVRGMIILAVLYLVEAAVAVFTEYTVFPRWQTKHLLQHHAPFTIFIFYSAMVYTDELVTAYRWSGSLSLSSLSSSSFGFRIPSLLHLPVSLSVFLSFCLSLRCQYPPH